MSTTPPLDPLDFLAIAREVAGGGSDAHLRTAVNRAYYCSFLIARDRTGVAGTKDIHKRVITAVRSSDPSSPAPCRISRWPSALPESQE